MITMHKFSFLCITLLAAGIINAQNIRLTIGKKYKVFTETKTISGMTIMGQQADVNASSTNIIEIEIKQINTHGYTLASSLKRITGSVNAMGQEQNFDSDNESNRNDPQMAEVFKMLNQPQEITVEHGKTISKTELSNYTPQIGGDNSVDAAKLILALPQEQLKQGYHWADSIVSAETSVINQYTITKVEKALVEVTVNTDLKISSTIKQSGIEIKQKMTGSTTSVRIYNTSNGLLISERSSIDMSGTAEVMGMNAPVTVKGTIMTTVE